MIGKIIKAVLKVVKKVVKVIAKVIKKIGQFVKKYWRVIVAVVVAIAVPIAAGFIYGGATSVATALTWAANVGLGASMAIGAVAGGLSALVMTGSLKGALKGAFFGAVTAGFANSLKAGRYGLGNTVTKVSNTLKVSEGFATGLVSATAHGVIGGARALVNGGKFFTGFVTGAVSKAFTIGTRAVTKNWDVFVKGVTVATVGGLTSRLAGGSFESGFLTAGLAFAINEVLAGKNHPDSKIKKVKRNPRTGTRKSEWREKAGSERELPIPGLKFRPLGKDGVGIPIEFNEIGYTTISREVYDTVTYDMYEVEYLDVNVNFFFDSVDTGQDVIETLNLYNPRIENDFCLSSGGNCIFDPNE